MEINNKVFCALPFTYVYVDSLNEYKLCSDARLSSKINTNDMSILEYFNSDYLNELRFDMLRGVLTDEIRGTCIRCIEREELGSWSRRIKKIDDKIIKQFKTDSYLIPTSDTIKIKFGNLCNLKCLMCGPYSSSRWAHERSMGDELDSFEKLRNEIDEVGMKKYGDLYENSFDDEMAFDMSRLSFNFNEKFYKEFETLIKYIDYIIISGGEPFLNDQFYEFLKWLIEKQYSKKINLIVFSNMTKMLKNYKLLHDKFKSFTINVSIDATYGKDEYIRRGTNFEEKDKNIKQLIKFFDMRFCPTMSILNVGYQTELRKYCSQFNKQPSFFNVLVEPFYLQINNLPHDIIELYRKNSQEHRLYDSPQKDIDHFKLGIKYLKNYDKIHNTNLLEEWPEFESYYYD